MSVDGSARTYAEKLQAGGTMVLSPGTTSAEVVGAACDLEDEFVQEGLMVFLAQRLVALREVVAFLHLEAFERLDQLHGIVAALELRHFHADLHGVQRLVVRLHVFVRQRTRRIDLCQPRFGFVEELCR